MVDNLKLKTPTNVFIYKFFCLRSKAYPFTYGSDIKNKLIVFSEPQSKIIKFEKHYICLSGGEYQKECDNYDIKSFYHEMYLQKVHKTILSTVDEK